MNERISIITPTFNRGYILGNAIKSVLNQKYKNWELIIIDDGSEDNTKTVIKGFDDKRIIYLKQKHKNQSSARNRGTKKASGSWICYIDSDNELLTNYLEAMTKAISHHPNALYLLPKANRMLELYENGKLLKTVDESGEFPDKLSIKDIFNRKIHFDLNGFMHSSKILDSGVSFDEEIKAMEDWDFVMQIGNKFPNNFLFVPQTLYNYHQRYGGDGIVSNTSYQDWAGIFEQIYQKHKNDKLMRGQKWYPDRVKKWKRIAKNFKKGLVPPPHLYHFNR